MADMSDKELCRCLIQYIGAEAPGSILPFSPEKLKELQHLIKNHLEITDEFKIDDLCIWMKKWWFVQILGKFEEIADRGANPAQCICADSPDSATDILFLKSWIEYFRETKTDEAATRACTVCLDYLIAWYTLGYLTEDPTKRVFLRDWSNGIVACVALGVYHDSHETDSYVQYCLQHMRNVIDKTNLRIKTLSETLGETPCKAPDEGDAGRDAM